MVNYAVDAVDADSTRIRTQARFGPAVERALVTLSILFWIGCWRLWLWLITMRDDFSGAGPTAEIGPVVVVLILFVVWLMCFLWLGYIVFNLGKIQSGFYRFLSQRTGLHHFAESPMMISWPAFQQVMVACLGIATIAASFSIFLEAKERIYVALGIAAAFGIIGLVLLVGRALVRWLLGQFAFSAASALSVYLLFPLMLWALVWNDPLLPVVENSTFSQPITPGNLLLGAVLSLLPGFLIMHFASYDMSKALNLLEYYKGHYECQAWSAGWRRLLLLLIILPLFLFSGLLFFVSFIVAILIMLWPLSGWLPIYQPVLLQRAAGFINQLVTGLFHRVGIEIDGDGFAHIFLMVYALPIVLWGISHILALAFDVVRYCRLWLLPGLPADAAIRTALHNMAVCAGIPPPQVRIDPSPTLYAYAAINPTPFLPPIIVISAGSTVKIPERCLNAVLAHELGHIASGHTAIYSLLRIVSRLLFLGPSFLTGLIKSPTALEAEADRFAAQWLDDHGLSRFDLVAALQILESQKMLSLFPRALRQGVAITGGPNADWLPEPLRRYLDEEKSLGYTRRFLYRWRLLHYLSLHGDLADYGYASVSDRIRTIRSFPHHQTI